MAAIADEPGLGIARRGWFRRPTATTGFWGWITTVDHKKIGILYGASAFVFFLIGGMEALLIRMQLARPDDTPHHAFYRLAPVEPPSHGDAVGADH